MCSQLLALSHTFSLSLCGPFTLQPIDRHVGIFRESMSEINHGQNTVMKKMHGPVWYTP